MKNILILSLLITLAYGCKVAKPQIVSIPFMGKKPAGNERIRTYLKIDSIQKMNSSGLQFSIIIENQSNEIIQLQNCLNSMVISITNKLGKELMPLYFSKGLWESNLPYKNTSFKVDAKIAGRIIDEYQDSLLIPAKKTFEAFITIPKILEEPGKSAKRTVIYVGKYEFIVCYGIIESKYREFFNFGPLIINYKSD